MENDLYDRQQGLEMEIPDNVVIIGAGGIGSNLCIKLAQLGVKKMIIVDADDIEYHNLNRTPFEITQIGMKKVKALKELIFRKRIEAGDNINKIFLKSNDMILRENIEDIVIENYDTITEFEIDIKAQSTNLELLSEESINEFFNGNSYVLLDTTDRYFNTETITQHSYMQNTYAKLNYDGFQVSITYNPYAMVGDEEPAITNLDEISESVGYRIIPSFSVPPSLICDMFITDLTTSEFKSETKTVTWDMRSMVSDVLNDMENTLIY